MTTRYLEAFDEIFAQGAVSSLTSPDTVTWDLVDNVGTVRDIVDNSSNLVDHVVYNSFGQVAYESAPSVSHFAGFEGGHVDPNTGLVNDYHRWYDPATGRWLGQDPAGFAAGDENLTRYVGNGPMSAADPLGLQRRPSRGRVEPLPPVDPVVRLPPTEYGDYPVTPFPPYWECEFSAGAPPSPEDNRPRNPAREPESRPEPGPSRPPFRPRIGSFEGGAIPGPLDGWMYINFRRGTPPYDPDRYRFPDMFGPYRGPSNWRGDGWPPFD